jgi:hypothetical protein
LQIRKPGLEQGAAVDALKQDSRDAHPVIYKLAQETRCRAQITRLNQRVGVTLGVDAVRVAWLPGLNANYFGCCRMIWVRFGEDKGSDAAHVRHVGGGGLSGVGFLLVLLVPGVERVKQIDELELRVALGGPASTSPTRSSGAASIERRTNLPLALPLSPMANTG